MLVTFSFGQEATYKRLVFAHYLFFCGGACACAPIAIQASSVKNRRPRR